MLKKELASLSAGHHHNQAGTYSINVGVRVLGLSMFSQNTRSNLVDLADELEHGVVGQMAKSKFALRHVTRIGLTEHSVSVSRNNLSGVQGGPEVVLDGLVAKIVTDSLLHLLQPHKHFLVSPTRSR